MGRLLGRIKASFGLYILLVSTHWRDKRSPLYHRDLPGRQENIPDLDDLYNLYDLYDLYDLAYVAGWDTHNLYDLARVSWVGPVLCRSCTTSHKARGGTRLFL